jgi:hypothetical protein
MPESLRTTIAQFSSAGGRWQPRAVNVRAVEPAPDLPSAERGSLYMLFEVSGGGHAALYRQMLNAAQTAFYEKGESVDAALRQAVRSAHQVLRQANEGLPEAHWRGGASLVVRYADRVTIAQSGPGLILISHPKTVDQFPAELGAWGHALGGEERPDIQVYDITVEPGSMILLAQSDWPHYVSAQSLAVAAAAPSVTLASQYLGQLAGKAELSALLVSFSSTIPELQDEVEPLPAVKPDGAESDGAQTAAKVGIFSAAGRRIFGSRSAEEHTTAPPASGPEPVVGPPSPAAVAAVPAAAAAVGAAWPAQNVPPPPPEYDFAEEAEEALPEEMEEEEARGSGGRFWLVLALIVIPLLIIGLVAVMLFGRARAAQQEFQTLLTGAAQSITDAEGLTDEAAIAQRLSGASDFLEKARARRPEDAELVKLDKRYQALLDKVEHVTPLYGAVSLWTFEGEGHNVSRVVVSGDSLFTLDRGPGQVDRFIRSQLGDSVTPSDNPVVVRKGQEVGGAVVSDLLDMTWAEAAGPNQRSKLLVLDTAKGLVGYDTQLGTKRLALGGADKLVQPQLTSGYDGNLYVADAGADQVWRYRPDENGYGGEPEPYFVAGTTVDLAGLQAMAIDGSIWLLFADGRLLKFFGGEQRPFDFQGLPGPLATPTALAVLQEGDQLYVLDAGNGRIVEMTKEGQFLRQFRARDDDFLRKATDMYLDEAAGKFYIVTPTQIYVADVPEAAAPAPES